MVKYFSETMCTHSKGANEQTNITRFPYETHMLQHFFKITTELRIN